MEPAIQLFKCEGCKKDRKTEGGYYFNIATNRTGMLMLTVAPAGGGFYPESFQYFACGKECYMKSLNEAMDKKMVPTGEGRDLGTTATPPGSLEGTRRSAA
ncbi:MAG: hypothetical protein HZA15_15580 [Nitrospirae bacterium]|nr:hypothetical protein [Nitrospirota bacterium]